MACNSCKSKKEFKKDIEENNRNTPKYIVWFVISWLLLGCYGFFSLISDLIKIVIRY